MKSLKKARPGQHAPVWKTCWLAAWVLVLGLLSASCTDETNWGDGYVNHLVQDFTGKTWERTYQVTAAGSGGEAYQVCEQFRFDADGGGRLRHIYTYADGETYTRIWDFQYAFMTDDFRTLYLSDVGLVVCDCWQIDNLTETKLCIWASYDTGDGPAEDWEYQEFQLAEGVTF